MGITTSAPGIDSQITEHLSSTYWVKQNLRVEEWRAGADIETWDPVAGDRRFLCADTTVHRTIPLNSLATRIIATTSGGSYSDRLKPKTHQTMEAMFE